MSQGFIVGKGGGMSKGAVKKGTIVVTYPEGSTCTVTDVNGKTYTALDTSGAAAFIVEPGTYTVTAQQGSDSASKTVTVTAGGWVEVELAFSPWIYTPGDEHESITGGWVKSPQANASNADYYEHVTDDSISQANKTETGIELVARALTKNKLVSASIYTANKIDLTPYKTLIIESTAEVRISGYSIEPPFPFYTNLVFGAVSSGGSKTIDVSGVNQACHILFGIISWVDGQVSQKETKVTSVQLVR